MHTEHFHNRVYGFRLEVNEMLNIYPILYKELKEFHDM